MTRLIPTILRTLVCWMSLVLAFTGWLQAQSFQLPQPQVITDRQGLPQAFVPSILQDKQGFIWAATRDGLCRYDGQRFKVFQPDPNGRPSLSFAGINQLKLDRHGRIWINSERGDIDVFDPRTETFTNVSKQATFRRLVQPGTTYSLYIDRRDRLWLMDFGGGLFCWDVAKKQGQWFRHQPQQASSISSNGVFDVQEDADRTIWLLTDSGLDRFDEATHRFTHWRQQAGQTPSLPNDTITTLRLRPNGELMLFSHHYLTLLQPRTGQLRVYPLPTPNNVNGVGWNTAIGRQGTVYFGRTNSLFRFTDQQGVQLVAQWDQPNDECRSLLVDRTNVLWMGTSGAGIRTYDLQPSPFQKYRYAREFYLDLLTCDSLGLSPVSPVVLATLRGSINYSFRSTFDRAGHFWFNLATKYLYRLNRKTGQSEPFPLPIRFRHEGSVIIPCPLTTDPQGRVWAVYDSTAFWCDEPANRWNRFRYSIPTSLGSGPITEFVVDEDALWLASQLGGLWRLDRHNGEVRQFVNRPGDVTSLSSNTLYCLSADPTDASLLWIGTFGSGLCLFDKRTGRFRRFTQANGLPNNVVYSALPDRNGYLWVGTNKGLCRMNRRSFTTQTFTRDDGIMADEFNRNHYVQFPEGNILMGGLEGFTLFNPRQIGQDQFEPVVELTQLQVNNQVIQPDLSPPGGRDTTTSANRSVLDTLPIQATTQLTLAHNQNYITIQFAALQFNRPARNRYRYRLEGLEEDWKETTRPEAVYTSLPPGNYVLLVNASNTSGRWSRSVRKLAITIQPPFWATWWAIGLYSLLGLGLAWGLLQVYLNRLRLRQAVQLRQQEADQLRRLDALKTRFFANVTHELRTPLTLILGPAQQLKTRPQDPNSAQWVALIDRQAQQLLSLTNQLLDLSRLEAGVVQVQTQPGDLVAFVAQLVDSVRPEADRKGLALSLTSALPNSMYHFDGEKLERILLNLLTNALKFTRQGSVQVTLRGEVELVVDDSGPGLTATEQVRIFDRYYQATPSSASAPGSGIGLALVNELVTLQEGTVRVISPWTPAHEGTRFIVRLPYQPVGALPDGLLAASTPPAPGQAPRLETPGSPPPDQQPLLLVVEDQPELRAFIGQIVAALGRVLLAEDGQAGWEAALASGPDLIISDVLMPRMDGFALCHALKQDSRTSHIPVLLLTAKITFDDRLQGLAGSADAYLTKPFHPAELQLQLRNLLSQQQRQRDWLRARLLRPDESRPAPATDVPGVSALGTLGSGSDPSFTDQLQAVLARHLSDARFGVDELASALELSRVQLYRKVKALTGFTVVELMRNYRLGQARQQLRTTASVADVAEAVGFESASYFTRCFREQYGLTPTAYQRGEEPMPSA